MTEWLLIAGDFTTCGGMDRANHALATALAGRADTRVHIVAHHVDAPLGGRRSVHATLVPRPFGAHLLGAPLLARAGTRRARALGSTARVVVNGGNALAGDIVWVHYVHAAYTPAARAWRMRVQAPLAHAYAVARERRALGDARVIVCNSRRTAEDVQRARDVDPRRIRVVYYGSDATILQPVAASERQATRVALGWDPERPVAAFVGALGDRRKGFDRLFDAWELLSRDPRWDVDLVVVGAGAELPAWQRRAATGVLRDRVRFLGFRRDVPRVLAACDLLVHPARYEAYGLSVHEAICRGVPALVSARAGIAELYPPDLAEWLLADVEDAPAIADAVRRWRVDPDAARLRVGDLAERLRGRTWDLMTDEFVRTVEAA